MRTKRWVAIALLTIFGTGAVVSGVVVWSSRYVPVWVALLALGIGGLCFAYRLERRGPGSEGKEEGGVAAGEEERERKVDLHRAALAAHLTVFNGSSKSSHQQSGGRVASRTPLAHAVFALGTLLGAGLVQWLGETVKQEGLESGSSDARSRTTHSSPRRGDKKDK